MTGISHSFSQPKSRIVPQKDCDGFLPNVSEFIVYCCLAIGRRIA
jgi:hypothetical protein